MNLNQRPFYLPEGLRFPKFFRSSTGRIDFERDPVESLKASNPDMPWDEGLALYVVMGWYEFLRREGYRDPVAEDYRNLINGEQLFANSQFQTMKAH